MGRMITAFGYVAGIAFAVQAAAQQPQVTVDTGTSQGAKAGSTLAFKGLPYAAPPVGPMRWRPPAPAAAWHGARDATNFVAACPQGPEHKEPWAQVGAMSEDCLVLNVWRPARAGK